MRPEAKKPAKGAIRDAKRPNDRQVIRAGEALNVIGHVNRMS